MTDAVFKDFQKGNFNTFLSEFGGIYKDLGSAIKKLRKWAKVKRVGTDIVNFPAGSYIFPEPLGVCLIIGAWNYPINLCLVPAISAIAAGNTVVLKPSELTINTTAVLSKMINTHFDPSFFTVVEGGVKMENNNSSASMRISLVLRRTHASYRCGGSNKIENQR